MKNKKERTCKIKYHKKDDKKSHLVQSKIAESPAPETPTENKDTH
jgi:hypothetical protein